MVRYVMCVCDDNKKRAKTCRCEFNDVNLQLP